MSEAVAGQVRGARSLSRGVPSGAGVFWFAVAMLGQWAFFYYIAAFYGASSLSGDFEVWNRLAALGRRPFVEGDSAGNVAYLTHALGAGIIAFGGALQLIPQIRKYAPAFHRWNGRLYLFTVTGLALSGFYLVWIRNTSPSLVDAISTSINGVLILTFAFLALRAALGRKFAIHQRWAMRLYLVSNAQWLLRVGLFGYFVVGKMLGAEVSFSDPFLRFWTFGCYLVPLAVLQLYFLAQDRGGALSRIATAGGLVALTLWMGVGIFAFSMFSQRLITGAPMAFPS